MLVKGPLLRSGSIKKEKERASPTPTVPGVASGDRGHYPRTGWPGVPREPAQPPPPPDSVIRQQTPVFYKHPLPARRKPGGITGGPSGCCPFPPPGSEPALPTLPDTPAFSPAPPQCRRQPCRAALPSRPPCAKPVSPVTVPSTPCLFHGRAHGWQ